MSEYQFPNHVMERFARHLRQEERSPGTIATVRERKATL